jgi:CheY-like chemotaxis protein
MPVMGGYEFLRAVRSDQALAEIPALVYTGMPDEESARQALACGVLAVLPKPGRPAQLMAAIRGALEPAHPA